MGIRVLSLPFEKLRILPHPPDEFVEVFQRVVRQLQPPRDRRRAPLFPRPLDEDVVAVVLAIASIASTQASKRDFPGGGARNFRVIRLHGGVASPALQRSTPSGRATRRRRQPICNPYRGGTVCCSPIGFPVVT
jgi:hypothetical protein